MLKESIDSLEIKPNGVYVDATHGGGGHSAKILEKLDANGKLFAFDQDENSKNQAIKDNRLIFVASNFRNLRRFLRIHDITEVDGILADLGVSSYQIDTPDRGFSYRYDNELDMRMDQNAQKTASTIINTYTEEELQTIFSKYGEIRNSKTLAQKIIQRRKLSKINKTKDLLEILDSNIIGDRFKYYSQVFQAIRIEVNDEINALTDFLEQSLVSLKSNGIIAVLSYHSLEDKLVKNFFKTGNVDGNFDSDFYGNITRPFEIITKKAEVPTLEEIKLNPRSRSAKLRVARKK